MRVLGMHFLSFNKFLLEPGVEYVWRVQAATDDVITLFHNRGYSEVSTFTYGSVCDSPQNPVATPVIASLPFRETWDDK